MRKKLSLAKQRHSTGVQTAKQGIRPIIRHAFRSCFLNAVRKERPQAPTPAQPILIKDKTD